MTDTAIDTDPSIQILNLARFNPVDDASMNAYLRGSDITQAVAALSNQVGRDVVGRAFSHSPSMVREVRALGTGKSKPHSEDVPRLSTLATIVRYVAETDPTNTWSARAFLIAPCPALDNKKPITLIHCGDDTKVLEVARSLFPQQGEVQTFLVSKRNR